LHLDLAVLVGVEADAGHAREGRNPLGQRQTSQVVAVSSSGVEDVCPGGAFVVASAGFEAAVEDADEAVGELTKGCLMTDLAGAELLVVGAGSR
jgi:hypothetical protein